MASSAARPTVRYATEEGMVLNMYTSFYTFQNPYEYMTDSTSFLDTYRCPLNPHPNP